ncbi:MAG: type II secretion system ATPase GspE [Xanthomonadales bacterium]|nr:type II secretion system ATPase GspE [Xanthomonadales bacterium]
MRGADIHALVETVAEITGRGFIVDPGVEGQVTVVSAQPMSREQVWESFLAVLRAHGYAVVPAGPLWRVTPEPKARAEGPPLAESAEADAMVTRVLELRHLASGEALNLLRPLLSPNVQLAAHPGSNALVVTDRAASVARIERLLARIDQAAAEGGAEVMPLAHASAGELARILGGLYGNEGLRAVADERANALVLSGERAVRLRARSLAAHLDLPPPEAAGGTEVLFLRYAEAEALVPLLAELAKGFAPPAAEGARGVSIQAHRETNALILSAPPAVQQALLAIARQLDVRRAQVLIEAIIVELADEATRELGVQWQSTDLRNTPGGGLGEGVIGGTNFPGPGGAGGILAAAVNPLSVGPGLNVGYVRGTLRLPGSDREILQIGALIRALAAEGRANILATPSVMTLDRHKAVFKAGQEVPFVTGQFVNTGGGSNQPQNPFQTIDRRDVGITLTVTPHVNEGDMVRLDIAQEVSSLGQQPAGAVDLVTSKRELSTSVIVRDGRAPGARRPDQRAGAAQRAAGAGAGRHPRARQPLPLPLGQDRAAQPDGVPEAHHPARPRRRGRALEREVQPHPRRADPRPRRRRGRAGAAAPGAPRAGVARGRRGMSAPPRPGFAFAKRHGATLAEWAGERARVICRSDCSPLALVELRRFLGVPFALEELRPADYERRLRELYEGGREAELAALELDGAGSLDELAGALPEPEDLLESEDDAPIVRFINALLAEAVRAGASDIHIEPFEQRLRVRFRIDGVLEEVISPARAVAAAVVSRIKVLAKLDIAEKRLPQDGRIAIKVAGRPVDVRVSTIPVGQGERVVLRLLDKQAGRLELAGLGMDPATLARLDALIHRPHGILLVTGPTGSGKTTTLYAALQRLNDGSRNILTVEDPVEYDLDGIGQTQVNPRVDMSFARGLRAILRQDPDVVMVGEIRDLETAQIAVQASLTGHLVLSTLHTNSAVGAVTRLRDMGVETFLLAESLIGVLAQRLVRRLVPEQREAYRAGPAECAAFGVPAEPAPLLYRPRPDARPGYRGRTGIYELLEIDEEARRLIHDGAAEAAILAQLRPRCPSILADGWQKCLAGITSVEEVLRVTRED